jgi:hypothetical protein
MGKPLLVTIVFFFSALASLLGLVVAFATTQAAVSESHISAVTGYFVDASEKLGIHSQHQASLTSRKYLLETMGSGVALFDSDNDGRLCQWRTARRSYAQRQCS